MRPMPSRTLKLVAVKTSVAAVATAAADIGFVPLNVFSGGGADPIVGADIGFVPLNKISGGGGTMVGGAGGGSGTIDIPAITTDIRIV